MRGLPYKGKLIEGQKNGQNGTLIYIIWHLIPTFILDLKKQACYVRMIFFSGNFREIENLGRTCPIFLRHVIFSYLLEEDEGVNKPEVMDSSKVVRSSEIAEMFSTL